MAKRFMEMAVGAAALRAQEHYYGRSRPIEDAPAQDPLGHEERGFLEARDSFYLATITESGWPYVQHRGGPPGFLRALDAHTLAFADYRGNRQMITVGGLDGNDRAALFLMDYANRARLKLFGRARVVDARQRPDLVERLAAPEMRARVERVIFVDVLGYDWNCPQYITPRFTAAEVEALTAPMRQEIATLRARLGETVAAQPERRR